MPLPAPLASSAPRRAGARRGRALAGAVLLALATGCASPPKRPDLAAIYRESAHYQGEHGNPVILIPGLMGSTLYDWESDQIVWGAFRPGSVKVGTPQGARIVALPMEEGKALAELRDSVRPAGVLERLQISLLRLPFTLRAYSNILHLLSLGGYRDESLAKSGAMVYGNDHFTCFQFDYDWRRSSVENAALLDEFIREKTDYLKKEYARRGIVRDGPIKFDLVAHSMGGLVARYYLRYGAAPLPADGSLPTLTWAGATRIDRAILVATPNAGSAEALERLTGGLSFPLLAKYPAAILGTFPSIYELLPRVRHRVVLTPGTDEPLDFMDPAVWEKYQWGLADPAADRMLRQLLPTVASADERHRIAVDHLRKSLQHARQFHAALDVPAAPPPGTRLSLALGDARPTPAAWEIRPDRSLHLLRSDPGDGLVTRASALMDERAGRPITSRLVSPVTWSNILILAAGHREMTEITPFINNMLYLLLDEPNPPAPASAPPLPSVAAPAPPLSSANR